jgi:hypothetical protein
MNQGQRRGGVISTGDISTLDSVPVCLPRAVKTGCLASWVSLHFFLGNEVEKVVSPGSPYAAQPRSYVWK